MYARRNQFRNAETTRGVRGPSSSLVALAALAAGVGAACEQPGSGGFDASPAVMREFSFSPQLAIGREGDPLYELGPISAIAISPEGDLHIGQPQDAEIRVYARDGTYARSIGRRGEGPGEFLRLGQIGFLNDTLWAVDSRTFGIIHFFSPDGTPIRMRPVPRPPKPFIGSELNYALPGGGVMVRSATAGELMRSAHEQPVFVWTADDSLPATLPGYFSPALTVVDNPVSVGTRTISDPIVLVPALAQRSWIALAPDGRSISRAVVESTDGTAGMVSVQILRYGIDGDTLASATHTFERHSVSPSTQDSLWRMQLQRVTQQTGSEERARRVLAGVYKVPDYYPPVREILVDADDRTWVRLEGPAPTRWLIFSPDLALLGGVDLPHGFRLMAAVGEEVWGVELDAYDVPQMIRGRVR